MPEVIGDFDLSDFWEESAYALETYVNRPLDDSTIYAVERELGYTLPASYVEAHQPFLSVAHRKRVLGKPRAQRALFATATEKRSLRSRRTVQVQIEH